MKTIFLQILAVFGFFTRLPLWRFANVPKEYYEKVVPYWPMVGWLTGCLTALVIIFTSNFFSATIAVILGLVARTLLTGALHEDGFADFCDGFGGGYNRQRILEIMKDSHIGTYGVLGLIFYYLLFINILTIFVTNQQESVLMMSLVIVSADSICKYLSSTIIYFLPYSRKEEESKNKLVYKQVSIKEKLCSLALTTLPVILVYWVSGNSNVLLKLSVSTIASATAAALIFIYMKKKIQGYTGDCCGATFIVTELIFYLAWIAN